MGVFSSEYSHISLWKGGVRPVSGSYEEWGQWSVPMDALKKRPDISTADAQTVNTRRALGYKWSRSQQTCIIWCSHQGIFGRFDHSGAFETDTIIHGSNKQLWLRWVWWGWLWKCCSWSWCCLLKRKDYQPTICVWFVDKFRSSNTSRRGTSDGWSHTSIYWYE